MVGPRSKIPPMTVAELVRKLGECDPAAPVILHDPDTGWALPLRWGIRESTDETAQDFPPGAVIVHADYSEDET